MWWREDQMEQNFQQRLEQQRVEAASVEAELRIAMRFELELKESLEATSTLETQLAEAELAVAAEKQVAEVLRNELTVVQDKMREAASEDDRYSRMSSTCMPRCSRRPR